MAIKDIYNGLKRRGGESLIDSATGAVDTASINSLKAFLSEHPEFKDVTNRLKKSGGEGITPEEYANLGHYVKLYDMRDSASFDTATADSDLTSQKAVNREKSIARKAVEFGVDVGRDAIATGIKAAGGTVQGFGQLHGLVVPSLGDNFVSRFGGGIRDIGTAISSPWLKEQEANYQDQSQGDGFVDEMKNTASALVNNPGAAAEKIANAGAMLVSMAGAARLGGAIGRMSAASKATVKAAARGASKSASIRFAGRAAAVGGAKAAAITGIGTGAALQGSGTATDTYNKIMNLSDEELLSSDEAREMHNAQVPIDEIRSTIANKYGRLAGIASAGGSLFFQKMFPLTEKAVSGVTDRIVKRGLDAAASKVAASTRKKVAKTLINMAKENVGEVGEEVSGVIAQNVGAGAAGSDVAWNEGLGRTVIETTAVTPSISVIPSMHEAGFDPSKQRSKAASRRDGTFSRTRAAAGEVVEPTRQKVAPETPAVDVAPEAPQVLTPEGTPHENLPVAQEVAPEPTPIETPAPVETPATEPVAETPETEVVNGQEEGQGREGLLKPHGKFDGVPDNEIPIDQLTIEEARELIDSRPRLPGDASNADRSDRKSLIHLLNRRVSWLSKPKKTGDTTYKDRNQADSDIRHEVSSAKKFAKEGDLESAKSLFEKMSDKYKMAYGEQASERMAQHWDIIKKSVKPPRTEDAGVKSNHEIKSLPDAKKIVSDLESKFAEWIANGSEPDIIDSYEVYKKAVTSLYPEGNKAQEYIDAKKAELSSIKAPEPVINEEPVKKNPVTKTLAEQLRDVENEIINEEVEDLPAEDQAALEAEMNPVISDTKPVKVKVPKDFGDKKPGTRVGKMIKDLAGKIKVTVGTRQGIYKVNGITFDLTGSYKGPEASAGIWSDIFSDPEIVSRVRDGLTKMGEAGKSTLDKMNDVADLLLDENGNPTPWAGVISDLFERDRDFEEEADSDESGLNFIFSDVALNTDDLAALQTIFEPKTARLNDMGTVLLLGSAATFLGLAGYGGYQGYKNTKKVAKKVHAGIAKMLADPVFQRHLNFLLPPQMVVQNFCRKLMNGPKEQADAARKLSNTVNDFIRWTSMKKTQLMNLYKPHGEVAVKDIETYGPKYRTWVEVQYGDVNHPEFMKLPSHIRDAFIAFKEISNILGAELKEQGGSPREHWASRISNVSAVRAISSEASRYIGSMGGEQITNMNKVAWKNILAKVPANSPLRRAIDNAVNDPVSGIIHGFIDASGNPIQNTGALPNYLKHEVIVDPKKSVSDYTPLFPAFMEYKEETRKVGDDEVKVLVPRVKAHTLITIEKDPAKKKEMIEEMKLLIEAEALRCISEMHDFEYNGGRGAGFANNNARERFFRTDGSLTNGREMPYLGDEMYISNPWEAIPQIIHRQTMGLGRWKFFGRQKEKLSPMLATLIAKRGEMDRLMGMRKPMTSDLVQWVSQDDSEIPYNGTLAQSIVDIAMGYHASKPLFGKDQNRYYDPVSPYSDGMQYMRNAVTKAQVDGFSNALTSFATFMMLRVKSGVTVIANEAAGPVGEALHRGMGSALTEYPKTRLEYSFSSEAEKRDVARGNSDASSRTSITRAERMADRYAKMLGQFDQSVSQMDLTARKLGEAAFQEMLMLYADARDLGWDENATVNKDLMKRAMAMRTDMELLYSPEELDRAIHIMDNLGPENQAEFTDIAGKFSYEYAKYVSGSSDMSAKSGLFRSWLFKNTIGFMLGTVLSIMMTHANSMLGGANLTGRTRAERIKSYAMATTMAGASMKFAKTSYFGSLILSSILTRSYKSLAVNTGLAVALGMAFYGGGPIEGLMNAYNPVSQAKARSEFQNTATNLNPGNWNSASDALMPAKFLMGSSFTGLPFGGRRLADVFETSTPIDQMVGGFKTYSSTPEQILAGAVPTVMFPINAGVRIGEGLSTIGSSLFEDNPAIASADRRYGAAKIAGAGGVFSNHVGDLSASGKNLAAIGTRVKKLQALSGSPSDAASENLQRSKIIRGR